MSQPRMRKTSAAGEVPRVRSTFVKASGDSSLNPNRQQQPRSRSNNKLPKNIRYDLDSALVGLCDVWFDEIKPHLIRNKIKVHIHGSGSCPASGDHPRVPPGAPGCSHLDPGAASHRAHQYANYAGCCSTPPTASRAPSRRPPAPPPCPASPLQLILQSMNAQPNYKRSLHPKKHLSQSAYQRHDPPPADTRHGNCTSHRRPFTAPCRRLLAASSRMHDKGSQTHFRYFVTEPSSDGG
ncbi:uncharacterized protein LOC128682094 isoform X2 [Plodia interpunctella]|uniref:uncharacterized protein LOC128682094 isoform X2 n=1 Tax=Plodia interpunctella TaxID=58824 RepID=UPI002368A38E|nr:uncharacterized protein LOC128682094 isoform X2 [Plodia interpunctella]